MIKIQTGNLVCSCKCVLQSDLKSTVPDISFVKHGVVMNVTRGLRFEVLLFIFKREEATVLPEY